LIQDRYLRFVKKHYHSTSTLQYTNVGPRRIETERVSSLDSETARNLGITKNEAKNKAISTIPIGRYGHPDEFASVVLFLESFANTFATGQSILVDGGMVKSI